MPSQKQLRWSQLKVGLTVVAASIILAIVILLVGGGGLFSKKIDIKSYFPDASGLRKGAPVRLSGVDIGNVNDIRVVPNRPLDPVEVRMRITTDYGFSLRKDSVTLLSTAGVLGETYINIDSSHAKGPQVQDGDVLASLEFPGYQEVMRAGQSSLQNLDALIKRMDRIIAFVESGQGSIGKLIYDEGLYNRVNATVGEFQKLVNEIAEGQGTLGQLVSSDELYKKFNASVDTINQLIDEVNTGNGTLGKFLKDPAFYNNSSQVVANFKQLSDDISSGKGALGTLAKDRVFAQKLQNTMNRLSNLADKLDTGNGTAALLMRDPKVYDNANRVLTDTQDLIKAVRENPKKYLTIHLKIF